MNTPILLINFNRPLYTRALIKKLKLVKPTTIFLGLDGPRAHKAGEDLLVQATLRELEKIDWDCDIQKNYLDRNLGCKRAIQTHLRWFFGIVNSGFILEDDCLPHPSFFQYGSELLERYKDDPEVASINGHSLGCPKHISSSYRFSPFMNMWGWATWKRTYDKIDQNMESWGNRENSKVFLEDKFRERGLPKDERWIQYWALQFNKTHNNEIDTWDYQWIYSVIANDMFSISPSANLIENIGWGSDATHTFDLNMHVAGLQGEAMNFPLIHPPNKSIDPYYEQHIKNAWCDLDRFYKMFLASPSQYPQNTWAKNLATKVKKKLIKNGIRRRYGI